jgi:four helix bundle protein
MLKSYKELMVWQKAYRLCLDIYRISKAFPEEEKYGLTAQMRRSAVSIPSNIAEGYGRKNKKEYVQALYIGYGSICELETQILLANDLAYICANDFQRLQDNLAEVERMLKALINSLKEKPLNPRPLSS